MTYQNLLLEQTENVVTLTINRPKALNSLNPDTLYELEAAVSALNVDPTVNVIIITGAGGKAFVAGGDISAMQPLKPMAARAVARQAQNLFNIIEHSPKIIIAAINGYALGGGCELAMSSDIRIASQNAKLGQPEINLGIIPGWAGTQRLPRLVGIGKAKEMMLTGDMINADEAERIGLVNRVVAAEELLDTAMEMAQKIARKPQVAIGLIKEAVDNGLEMPVDKAISYEAELFGLCFATEDQKEGMAAFLEKREAKWKNC
ncbi:MAG TPA: enoyl-CoA hydratase-related protein [Geopsychrobacteraceae bacterium]|nr:enoyl-CoA hydratase-related protein [Geopsychrobacteraceae bacterium]